MKSKHGALAVRILILWVLLIMALGLASCGKSAGKSDKYRVFENTVDSSLPIALGNDRDIYVFADEDVWKVNEDLLRRSLERMIYIVYDEKYFTLIKSDIKDIDSFLKYKNLLFLGDLKSKGAVSSFMRNSLDKRLLDRVKNSGGEMFVASNRWSSDQQIVYLIGDNLTDLVKINALQTNRLYNVFLNRFADRLGYTLYRSKVIPQDFFNLFPYSLQIPDNFRLYMDDKQNRFLSFLYRPRVETRFHPDRYVSVYYEDMPADSVKLNWLLRNRTNLAKKYYEGDTFDPKMVRTERVAFGKYTAWHVIGPWKNEKYAVGGGFQAFAFYDAAQKRAYLIDNAVYFPDGDKLPELLALQKIALTFKTK